MSGFLKAFNLVMSFVNKLMGNLQRAEDKKAGAEEVKSKQYEERLAKIREDMEWLFETVARLQIGERPGVTEMAKVADYWQRQAEKARERVRELEAEQDN